MTTREQNVRTWAMLCHLSALAGLFFSLGSVIGPLLVWQIKKNELPEIDPHGKEALNFQLTILLLNIVAGIFFIGFLGAAFGVSRFWTSPFSLFSGGFGIVSILVIINLVAWILAVIAGLKANNGESYKYPFSIKFIK
ncbi:DUF4870 domain-containing protein [Niastella caeni]|uniref:DUF4870 domain-containing protein n=1 Tax=Niastella caeni TaxID=2569763 RepID=A0A4S8I182_9BACT|nr:DUF4870 domain-containing protein [Niastella caeni]THU41665.1 DUF4870 domain-containing protein [Niastella caeni]